jgi:hypothetical protein
MSLDITNAVSSRKRKLKTSTAVPGAKALANGGEQAAVPEREPEYVWGAERIGRVIGADEKATFNLIYRHALDGAIKKVEGKWCGNVAKLRALLP